MSLLGFDALGRFSLGQITAPITTQVAFGWLNPLSEPVRIKPGIAVSAQPFITFNPRPLPASNGWFEELSSPVRKKPFSQAAEYPNFFYQPAPSPFVATGWYANLSEPVRIKPRLMVGLQGFLERNTFIPISFTASMKAIEQGDIFLAVLYQFNRARRALVSIFKK